MRFLSNLNFIQRWLCDVDVTGIDQRSHVSVEESQQQRDDVISILVCIHQQHHFVVAQALGLKILADATAQRRDDVGELFVGKDL